MKKFLLIALVCCFQFVLIACDSCSGAFTSAGNQSFQLEKNHVGIVWTYFSQLSKFKTFELEKVNKIRIQQFTFNAAFNVNKRINLSIALPSFLAWSNNELNFSVGDPSFNFRYKIWNSKSKHREKAAHKIYGSGGLKFPLGIYINKDINQVNNINFSTKSVDFLLGFSYLYEKKDKGLIASFNAKINTKSKAQERFGNAFVLRSLLYAKTRFNKVFITPFCGVVAEYITKDFVNGFKRPFTGGTALYLTLGGNFMINDYISISVSPELPVFQDYKVQNGTIFTNIRTNLNTKILF